MPGTDPDEAIAVVLGELPDLPFLPELPTRGPGADLTGRTAALLVDLPVETTVRGWKFAARPGRDQRRAASLLEQDLDALQQAAERYTGALKIQLCGPWTLAATIELSRSQEPALADPAAVADLMESLAEGVTAHMKQIRGRVPGATVLLQLDEPALPGVLAGSIPTASGLNRVPAVDAGVASGALRSVLGAASAFSVLHCCAAAVPFRIACGAGADAISFDPSLLPRDSEDEMAESAEAGLGMLLGALPTSHAKRNASAGPPRPRESASGPQRDSFAGSPQPRESASGPQRDSFAGSPQPRESASGANRGSSAGSPRPRGTASGAKQDSSDGSPQPRDTASAVIELWHRLGMPPGRLAEQVVITPACGLAAESPAGARAAIEHCRRAAGLLAELIEEGTP
jgi:hypothetical protein